MLNKLFKSTGLQQSAILIGGNFFATLFSALGLILISRQLGPVLFGEFTVGYSLMVIVVRLQGLGLNVAIQKIAGKYFSREDWSEKLSALLQVSTGINIALVVISLLVSVLISVPLAHVLKINSVGIIIGSFVFASITLFFEYLTTVLQIIHKFAESVYMMVAQSVLKLVVAGLAMAISLQNATLVFYGFYFTPLIAIFIGFWFLPKKVKLFPLKRDPQVESQLLSVMKHTAILMATAGLIDYIDVLMVKHYTTPFETGIYGGITQLASAVLVIGYSLASVLNARVARYHDKIHIDAYLKKSIGLIALAIIGFIVYLPLAKLSINITIGAEYLAGLPFLIIMMLSSFLVIATVPLIAVFYSLDAPLYFSVSGLGQLLIVLLGGNYFISHYGLEGAVWTKVATRIFLLVLTLAWLIKAYRKKYYSVTSLA